MPKRPGHRIRCRPDFKPPRPVILAVGAVILMAASLYAQAEGPVMDSGRSETAGSASVSLYFAAQDRFALLAEPRQLPRSENPVALGRHIIRELAAGPRGRHLVRTLPHEEILRAFFIAADKTAYVDLHDAMWTHHPGCVQSDILAVYSIVNSLVLNLAEIDAVKILSRGREPLPTAGHLDLRYPLKANILLIR